MTFHHDSVLSDVHMLQPRARHLMTRLNRAGQPVFMSRFRLLPRDETEDSDGGQTSEDQETRGEQDCGQASESRDTTADRPSPEDQDSRGEQNCGQTSEDQETRADQTSPEQKNRAESLDEDQGVVLDQDGDLDFVRRRPRSAPSERGRDVVCPVLLSQVSPTDPEDEEEAEEDDCTLESTNTVRIEHTMATVLDDVGKQVWRGALLLADWVLSEPGAFAGATVLELGAGTGLSSIITASVAKRVYCTDVGEDLLSMCERNVSLNKHLTQQNGGEVRVRQLDWLQRDLCTDSEQEFSWSEEEVDDLYDHTTVIIAADVVYDDDFTDAFFRTLYQLCSSFNHNCEVYISLEKRLNFTLRHMDVCCEAYEHFRLCLQQLQGLPGPPAFSVQRVAPSFPQRLAYERVEQLELWKVSASFPSDHQVTQP